MSSSNNPNLTYLSGTIDKLLIRLSSIKPSSLEQLEQWRQTAYQSIDVYCQEKRHEFIEKKEIDRKQELNNLKDQINQLYHTNDIQQDDYDSIHHQIQLIEIKINELEHLRLTLRPLSIDQHLITRRHLFPLSDPYRSIHLKTGIESAIATNDQHLLVYRDDKYLCLLDRNLTILEEIPFNCDTIHGICWSSTMNRFIIITFKQIFLFNDKRMNLENCSIQSNIDWWRGTCSENTLFLSTVEWGSAIYEFNLESSFELIKQWHSPVTCKKDEIICDLKYSSDGFLAMPIFNKHKDESRLDLRSATTFDCIWSVRVHGRCRCCSIDVDQWLVMDHDDRRFFHISADGKLLKTDKYNQHERLEDIISWDNHHMLVLTDKAINLHIFN